MGDATQKTVRCYTGTRVVPHGCIAKWRAMI
jgi:hypothetical protein